MRHKVSKTSSFIVDLTSSTFHRFTEKHQVYEFSLPSYFQDRYSEYGILHNWAKDNLSTPYYLNIPSKKLYVLTEKSQKPMSLSYDGKEFVSSIFEDFWSPKKIHIVLKLLQAKYFESNERFVSNDKFFLYASLNRAKSWATVLRVELVHNYKNQERIEFFLRDEATRLRRITLDEFNKYYSKEIIYGQSIKDGQLFFKQLKRKEISEFKGQLFSRPKSGFVGNTKAKLNFHSIMDTEDHESSKGFLLERFCENFREFVRTFDIDFTSKELRINKIDFLKNKTELPLAGFKVCIIDGRRIKHQNLNDKFSDHGGIIISFKSESEIVPGDNCLFVMDYNKEDFEDKLKGEVDPYSQLKSKFKNIDIATQGICLNENFFDDSRADMSVDQYFIYAGLGEKDIERNFGICVSQLFLKRLLIAKQVPASLAAFMDGLYFGYRNCLLSTSRGTLQIQKFESPAELLLYCKKKLPNIDTQELQEKIYAFHHPFGTGDFDFLNHKFVFSAYTVFEVMEIPERAFYEETEIQERIKERNKVRPKSEFKSSADDEVSRKFNAFIDEDVDDAILSFEELKSNYGKTEDGFLKRIFNSKDERAFVSFLNANTEVKIKGLKEGGVFSTYSGVWFEPKELQYFVGRVHGYQYKQDKAAQMRKIKVFQGVFNPDKFFELLNVDFIRHKEVTVLPFPFKLIEMHEQLSSTEGETENELTISPTSN